MSADSLGAVLASGIRLSTLQASFKQKCLLIQAGSFFGWVSSSACGSRWPARSFSWRYFIDERSCPNKPKKQVPLRISDGF